MHVMIPALTPNDVSKPFHSVGMTPNDPKLTFLARVPLSLCQARINLGIKVVQLTPMMTPVVIPTMSSDVLVSNHVTQYLLQISLQCQRDTVLNSFQGQVLDKAIETWPVSIPNTPKPRRKFRNLATNNLLLSKLGSRTLPKKEFHPILVTQVDPYVEDAPWYHAESRSDSIF